MKRYNITVNGITYDVAVEEVNATYTAPVAPVTPVAAPAAAVAPKAPAAPAAAAGSASVKSPYPGTILEVKVSVGQSVKKGDVVCVLEAMKMAQDIPAPQDGVVASVNVQKGASVESNDVLVTFK